MFEYNEREYIFLMYKSLKASIFTCKWFILIVHLTSKTL